MEYTCDGCGWCGTGVRWTLKENDQGSHLYIGHCPVCMGAVGRDE